MEARSAYLDWLGRQLETRKPRVTAAEGAFGPDLVIGYATGYSVAVLAPFVRSLRAHFNGRIGLYVDARRPEVDAFLADYGVDRLAPPTSRSWKPFVTTERFGAYLGGLQHYPHARHVLMTDVRDVVFQGPPLAEPVAELEFFPEDNGARIADDAHNLRWLKRLFSSRIAEQVAGRACLCAGTIVGRRAEIERLCRIILFLSAIPRSSVGGAFGADQAAFNLAAYLGLCGGAARPNFERVATLEDTPSGRLRWEGGKMLNPDGGVSPILHKYDRYPEIVAEVTKRWAADLPADPPSRRIDLSQFVAHTSRSIGKRLPEIR